MLRRVFLVWLSFLVDFEVVFAQTHSLFLSLSLARFLGATSVKDIMFR